MQGLVYVRGSHGTLTVHAASGVIVERDDEPRYEADDNGYDDIARFDPLPFERVGGTSFDILETGYWNDDGSYAEPLTMTLRTYSALEYVTGEMCFEDWAELRLLPAPAAAL